ncbi:hypothetical protein [Streptomyces sp. NPDC089799]|uniref:hypothetical protein n=1 Tax=Streptomyces sp. NPDC089799 TaxID=3155066 RepID=UPI00341270C4
MPAENVASELEKRVITVKRSAALMRELARVAGAGTHQVTAVCMTEVNQPEDDDYTGLRYAGSACDLTGPVLNEDNPTAELLDTMVLLAQTYLEKATAMLVLRRSAPDGSVRVCAWKVVDLFALPLTAGQSFTAACLRPDGQMTGPEPGVKYDEAPFLVS